MNAEFDKLVADLRETANAWFNPTTYRKLERLIEFAEKRNAYPRCADCDTVLGDLCPACQAYRENAS